MAGLPPVQIQFVAGGVSNVLSAIKTLEQAFTQLEAKITNLAKKGSEDRLNAYHKEFQEKKSIAERFATEYGEILQKEVQAAAAAAKKKEEIERQHTSILRNEAHKRGQIFSAALQSMGVQDVSAHSHIAAQTMAGAGMAGSAALLAGSAAFFGTGGTRGAWKFPKRDFGPGYKPISKSEREEWELLGMMPMAPPTFRERAGHAFKTMRGGIEKGMEGAGSYLEGKLDESWAKTNVLGTSIMTVVGSLYALKRGLDVVTGGLSQAAHEMAGGVMQIGGGFSISGSMAGAASLEANAAQIAANQVRGGDLTSRGQIISWARGGARGTEHTPEQFVSGLRSFQGLTGRTRQFMELAPFISQLASVSGASFEQLAMSAGQAGLQFPEFNSDMVKQVLLRSWQAGKTGAIEIKDAQTMARVTAGARMLHGGPTVENYMRQIGAVQIARRAVASPEEAVTAYERFQQFSAQHAGQIEAMGGKKVMVTTPRGEEFRDITQTLIDASRIYQKHGVGVAEKMFGREGLRMAEAVSAMTAGKSDVEARKNLNELMEVQGDLKDAAKELENAFKEVTNTTQYQLKQAFNELTDEVGTALLSTLKESMPEIKGLIKDLVKSIPTLMTEFLALKDTLPLVGDAFIALTPVVLSFAKMLLEAVGWMTDMPAESREEKKAELESLMLRLEEKRQQDKRSPTQQQGIVAQDIVAIKDILGRTAEEKTTLNLSRKDENSLLFGSAQDRARVAGWYLEHRPEIKGTALEQDLKRVMSLEEGNQALIEAAEELNNAAMAIETSSQLSRDPFWQGPPTPRLGPAGSRR